MQHHGYTDPQSQVPVDPYAQQQQHSGYGQPASQGYAPANGYSQQGYGTATTAYGTGTEYDQSQQYTDYRYVTHVIIIVGTFHNNMKFNFCFWTLSL